MTTGMITVKMEKSFLKKIDQIVKKEYYQNRTEFIRAALREKVDYEQLKRKYPDIVQLKGAAKRKVTDGEYDRARDKAFEEVSKKLK